MPSEYDPEFMPLIGNCIPGKITPGTSEISLLPVWVQQVPSNLRPRCKLTKLDRKIFLTETVKAVVNVLTVRSQQYFFKLVEPIYVLLRGHLTLILYNLGKQNLL